MTVYMPIAPNIGVIPIVRGYKIMNNQEEKCPNCKRPNLIKRPWKNDIWCGWCGSICRRMPDTGIIFLVEGKNEHLVTEKRKIQAKSA